MTGAIVDVVSSKSDKDENTDKVDIPNLYEELKQFAPAESIDDMALLAARLKELQSDPADKAVEGTETPLDAIWAQVERQFDE